MTIVSQPNRPLAAGAFVVSGGREESPKLLTRGVRHDDRLGMLDRRPEPLRNSNKIEHLPRVDKGKTFSSRQIALGEIAQPHGYS